MHVTLKTSSNEVLITGVGLASSLGADAEAHHARLFSGAPVTPAVDEARYAPYPVHPFAEVDFSREIPKKSDQRQMELWRSIRYHSPWKMCSIQRWGISLCIAKPMKTFAIIFWMCLPSMSMRMPVRSFA